MKTQLEESKRIEEILKNQLEEKEQTIQKLEMEVVGLRKKGEKTDAFVKFKDSSVVLDKILDCQRSPFNKSSLGYKKEGEKYEYDTWTPKTQEAGPSSSKVAPHSPAHKKKTLEVQICIKELEIFLK